MSFVQRLLTSRMTPDHIAALRDKLMPQVIEASEANQNLRLVFEEYRDVIPTELNRAIARVLETTNPDPEMGRRIQAMLGETDAPS
jgi:hypothetical protein